MKTTPEQEQKILSIIEAEWQKFLSIYIDLSPKPSDATITALKAGFYTGFKAGVIMMYDAENDTINERP
jgi:hypothetical protein